MKTTTTPTETEQIAALIEDIGSNSAATRNRAHRELVALGHAAIGPLLDALNTSTEYGRGQAAKALGDIGDPSTAPSLVRAMEDLKFDVRWMAARAVVSMGQPGLEELLRTLIKRPHSVLLRQSAHHVLHDEWHTKWSRLLSPVMEALECTDPEDAVPPAATKALQAISDPPTKFSL
jgi:HEAT repeat protein